MTPSARLAASIELLAEVHAAPRRPADAVANDFFRARRYIGSGDRRAVSDRAWRVLRARRLRDRFLGKGLFEDPAWDMLLDLYASRLEGRRVSVSSLCIAAAVPPTTALRWIKMLTDAGLFVRRADPTDGRRVFVELGADAAAAMRGYLRAVRRDQAALSIPSSDSLR